MSEARAYWSIAPGCGEIRSEIVEAGRLRMLYSGISQGTERLIARGHVPQSQWQAMRCPNQVGDFPFPVKYGYQAVATDGKRLFFALYPHQDRFDLPDGGLFELPPDLPARRAILAANMETALNALWDSGAGPGDRINVIGAGVVGALIAYLCSRLPGTEVRLVDMHAERAVLADQLGLFFAPLPDNDADIVFNASASADGLDQGLQALGMEGRLVEVSWYGNAATSIMLGGNFHSRRLTIISSQVGMIAPSRRARWTHRRRLMKALTLLAEPKLDCLIDREIAFEELPAYMAAMASDRISGLCTAIRYQT